MRNFLKCLLTLKTSFSFALLLLLSFFVQGVSAAPYYWKTEGSGNHQGSTPQAAAQKAVSVNGWQSVNSCDPHSATMWVCRITTLGVGFGFNMVVIRYGDQCDFPNATYDILLGKCISPEPDKCEPTIGKRIGHYHNFGTLGANANEAPITVCEGSCQYSNTFETPNCNREFPDKAFCSLTYLGNGVECTEGDASNPSNFDQPPTKPPETREPTREHEQKCDNWVTGEDGVARRTCTSKDEYKSPGELKCENTNGYLKCAPGTPPPAYTKTETTAETAKTDNPDGSSKTETTTKKDVTNCHGAKPCNTSSTEKKEIENKNADGTPGEKTTTCTGDKCTVDKDPEPGTDPDKEKEEEEEEKSSVSGGDSCNAPPTCKGDAIQCAILRQEYTQRCADEEFREVTTEKTQALKSDLDAAFSGEKYQPIKATAENTFALDGMIDTSSRFSSSCPVLPTIPYKWVDGSSQNFNPNVEGLCSFLTWMGFLMVAFAMRGAAEIIAGGLK